jgi:hypothetical protein
MLPKLLGSVRPRWAERSSGFGVGREGAQPVVASQHEIDRLSKVFAFSVDRWSQIELSQPAIEPDGAARSCIDDPSLEVSHHAAGSLLGTPSLSNSHVEAGGFGTDTARGRRVVDELAEEDETPLETPSSIEVLEASGFARGIVFGGGGLEGLLEIASSKRAPQLVPRRGTIELVLESCRLDEFEPLGSKLFDGVALGQLE